MQKFCDRSIQGCRKNEDEINAQILKFRNEKGTIAR